MFDKTKDFLIFNGEIYNFRELKNKLKNKSFNSNSDSEILLYTLIERGINSIIDLEGMFSFIFCDTYKNTFYVGRDRFGIKPLYYTKIKNSVLFSSEIKPLLSFKKNTQLNNLAFVTFFLKVLWILTKETFFNGIYSIERYLRSIQK